MFKLIRKIIILVLAVLGIIFLMQSFSQITGKIMGFSIIENVDKAGSISLILGVLLIIASLLLYLQLKYVEKRKR